MSSSRLLVALLRSERNRLSSSSSSGSSNRAASSSSSSSLRGWLAFARSPPPSTSFHSSFSSLPPAERGPTAFVYEILQHSEAPQTTAQLWESAQESIKSKRHLKSLLASLKSSGKVKTTPGASGRSYGYSVRQGPPKQKATTE